MEEVYLVTMEIEKLSFPVGYFMLDEALRIKREMLETYRSMGFKTKVHITRFEKLPANPPGLDQLAPDVLAAN
ncbi:hypothetical protein [Planococcus lenghuensis]|uniref:Uncharacterized protein n=1 Tax=Planococcus lenghuensis TaxID=2213202 RepID=A0A1Q2KXN1_9BACL|nr:hypothetical protein [Planococcus lenghuensis]AQQ52864.1 hypothetical protein B0X71_07020 [Planococcus lenghuensis]